jgi:hypothetical protein
LNNGAKLYKIFNTQTFLKKNFRITCCQSVISFIKAPLPKKKQPLHCLNFLSLYNQNSNKNHTDMSVELKGRMIKKLPVVNGESRNGNKWEKQEFVIETEEQYPKKVCISVWGDRVRELEKFQEGDMVVASVNIESREYNERWYTDIRAWRLQRDESSNLPPLPPEAQSDDSAMMDDAAGDLPF